MKQTCIRLEAELHKSVALQAIEMGISRNELITQALREYMEKTKTNEVKPC